MPHVRKKEKSMKYETPELTALTPAINAIQATGGKVGTRIESFTGQSNDVVAGYVDWED